MATQIKRAEPDVVGQIILLRPDEIDASDRLRPIDPVWAEALAGVMQAEGQRTPIEVCRLPGQTTYKLVTGGHRHAAAQMKGLYLRAEVVTNDATERRLREISENLHRRDLAPIDRASFIAELVAVHKARAGLDASQDGRAASANARWQQAVDAEADDTNATIALAYGWADQVADNLGYSRRTIYNDLLLVRRIPASVIDALRRADHPVLRNAGQLRALAKLDDSAQRKVAGLLIHADMQIAGAPFSSVSAAIAAMADKPAPSPDAKRLSAFIGSFGRMALAEKKGALSHLAGMLPAGWSLGEGSAVTELRSALDVAFRLLIQLGDGEPVDDEDIHHALDVVQRALMNSAPVEPENSGEKA